MPNIHPSAIIDPTAMLADDVVIGPYCMIGPRCVVGAGTVMDMSVHLKQDVTLGERNRLHTGVVLGDAPQHLAYKGHMGRVTIGNDNTLREYVTIHKPFHAETDTSLGNNCFLMVSSHVAHDCKVGDNVTIANFTALAGHVVVERQANISGLVGVHQFARIGRLAMVGGASRVPGDVPPFVMATGGSIHGLNVIGMKRNGLSQKVRSQIKATFKMIFTQGHALTVGVECATSYLKDLGENASAEARHFVDFIEQRGKRPVLKYVGPQGSDESESESE